MSDPGLSTDDRERLQAMRRMKLMATALLVAAAAVYFATLSATGGWGYVNAGAEAAMVGAVADWFAVTALFRHPLGLPIPHTALIPRRKDALGRSLEDFVATNFMEPETIAHRLVEMRPAWQLGRWLNQSEHRERVLTEASQLARSAIGKVGAEQWELVADDVLRRAGAHSWGPAAGRWLGALVHDGAHRRLVDVAVIQLDDWVAANQEQISEVIARQAPRWTPHWVDQQMATMGYRELQRWVHDIRGNPEHPVRGAVDDLLLELAENLQHDPGIQTRVDAFQQRVLTHQQTRQTLVDLAQRMVRSVTQSLADPGSPLRRRAGFYLERWADKLSTDVGLQQRVDTRVGRVVELVVTRYRHDAVGVISATIARWDGEQAARRIELYVGRDLQFIRMNGTIVGALVGVIIHAVSHLLA